MIRNYSQLYQNFIHKNALLVNRAQYIQNQIPHAEKWRITYLSESLLNQLWQLWCNFCRQVIITSCQGTLSRQNSMIQCRTGNNLPARIGYEAACGARGQNPNTTKTLRHLRQEPTWGDQDKIVDMISTINPNNKNTLLTAFGLPLIGPKHLQIVRNACAHKNSETLNSVRSLTIHYSTQKVKNPSDLAWEISIGSNSCGIYAWIDDMQIIADQATITA